MRILFVRKENKNNYFFFSTIHLLCVTVAPFWRISPERKLRTLFCVSHNTRMRYFHSNQSVNACRKRILVLWLIQKSVRSLRSVDNLQNGATLTRRDTEESNCHYFYFPCVQKVFSSLHKVQIEPLMADGLS